MNSFMLNNKEILLTAALPLQIDYIKLHAKTFSLRLKTDQHKTDSLTSDSRQMQTQPDHTIRPIIAPFTFLAVIVTITLTAISYSKADIRLTPQADRQLSPAFSYR